ncbi:MAG: helix-turn-helix domain-containing protein [Alphaproteobacteria bacterium]|nr:helix-turn-helix domain-containing protein [Alphaproteobacteria bacterium]
MTVISKNEPVKIFIEAKYIGRCLHRARIQNKISRKDLAKKLKLTDRQLLYIECGRVVIAKDALTKLMQEGMKHY